MNGGDGDVLPEMGEIGEGGKDEPAHMWFGVLCMRMPIRYSHGQPRKVAQGPEERLS